MDSERGASLTRLRLIAACAAIALLGACAFGALGIVALSKPLQQVNETAIPYTSQGTLSYQATTNPGSIYGNGGATTGEPLFLTAIKTMQFRYSFRLNSKAPIHASGSIQLALQLIDQGFSQTLVSQGPERFTGTSASASLSLSAGTYQEVVKAFDAASGAGIYNLNVLPVVRLNGTLDTEPIHVTLSSGYSFEASDGFILPSSSAGSLTGAAPSSPNATSSPFVEAATHTAYLPSVTPTRIAIGPFAIGVGMARIIAGVAILLLLALAAVLGRAMRSARRSDGPLDIAWRYQGNLVSVDEWREGDFKIVDLPSIDGLARLAKRFETVILEIKGSESLFYVVLDGPLAYRYIPPPRRHNADEVSVDKRLGRGEDPIRSAEAGPSVTLQRATLANSNGNSQGQQSGGRHES